MSKNDNQTELRADSPEHVIKILEQSNGNLVVDTHALYEQGRVFLRITDDEVSQVTLKDTDEVTGYKAVQKTITREGLRKVVEQASYLLIWPYEDSAFTRIE